MTETPRNRRFLAASLAALFVPRAGQKYRPSNGTEGDYFEAAWCNDCRHNADCNIWCNALLFRVDEPEYPTELQYAADGNPCCTAHEPLPEPGAVEKQAASCAGQKELFEDGESGRE